jgi:hypothetical protein
MSSLGWELMSIQAAVDGARILVDGIATHQFGSEHDEKAAPHAAAATLSLVSLRLRELWRAVQGATNPADTVWASHNATEHRASGHDDIYLTEWSAEQTLIAAEDALARAHAAVDREQPKGRRKGKR